MMESTIRPETSVNFMQLTSCKDPEATDGDRHKYTCGIIWMQSAHTNVATGIYSLQVRASSYNSNKSTN